MPTDPLSRTFSALAHPTRRAILARLREGEASVQELARPFKLSAPAISRHLKVLEESGLITRGRDAQWRPCRLDARPLGPAVDWIEHTRRDFEARFDRLDAYLHALQTSPVASPVTSPVASPVASPVPPEPATPEPTEDP